MGLGSKAGARAAAVVGAGAGATTQKGCCRHSSRKKRRLAVLFAAVLPIVSGFVPQLPRPRLGLLPSFPASSDGQRRAVVSVHTSTRPTRRVLRLSSADDHGSSSEPASASAGATAVLEEEEEEGGRGSGSDKNKTKGGGKVAVAQAVVATVGASVINAAAASAKPVGALVNKVRSNPLSRPKQEKVDEAGKVVINWEEKEPFNLETAVLLAGFAFESYLDPADSKWSLGRDGTKVAFRDDEFVTEVFKGLLCVTVHSAENLPKQSGFAETVLSGAGVDTYADLRIENDAGCLDSTLEAQQSHVVRDRSTPRYGEMFQLYVGDATKATLNITIIDQELFGPDIPLGTVSFPVQTFAQEGMVEDGAPKAWEDWAVLTPCSQEVARRVEIGGRGPMRVRMDVMYVPFGPRDDPLSAAEAALREAEEEGEEEEEERAEREREEEEAEEEEERKRLENLARFITGPRGATDGVDWRVLAQKVGGFATVAKDFTPTFFLEQDDTDTQVDVWRDRSTKRLVISFRGTESIKWRDFVTDANFLQVPYDDEDGAVFSDKMKSKVESAKRQVGGGGGKKERRGLSALLPRLLPGRRRRREDEEAAAAAEEAAAVAAASAAEAAVARAVAEEAAVGGITDQMAEVLTGLEKLRSDIPASVREGLAVVPGVTQSLNQISSNLDVLKRVALTASTTDGEDGEEREKEEEEEGEEEGGPSVGGRGEEGGGGDEGGGGGGGGDGGEGESWDTKAVGSKRIKSSSSNSRDEKAERKRLQSLRLSAQVKQREEQQKNVLGDWAGLIQESLASSVYDWVKSTRAFEPSSTHHEHGEGDEDGEGEGEGEGAQRGQAEGRRRRRRSKQQQQEQQLRIPDTPMQSFQRFVNSSIEDLKKESMAANGGGGGFNFSFDMQDFLVSSGLDVAAMPPIMANLTALGQAGSNITTLEQFTNMFASVLSDSIPKSVGQQALVQGQGQGGGLDDLLEELRAAGKAASDDSVQSFLSSLADLVQMSSLKESVPLVHTGFKSAYDSTQETLRGMVETAVEGDIEGYHILVTGHSLGGALAVLASLDIKRRHPEAWVTCYSFGAPRAGNTAFANVVNANLDEYFRVVNDKDIIPRMPRGRVVMRALDYEHGGRTVLVDEDNQGSLWIEGESEGMDQLKDLDPSVMLLESISRNIDGKEQEGYQLVIQDQDAQEGQEGQHTTEEDDQHSSPQEEQGGFLSMMKREGEGKGQEKEGKRQEEGEDEEGKATKSTSMTKAESNDVTDHKHDKVEPIPTTMASALSFLDRELLLLDALLSGEAFAHHFEADYFKALDLAAGVPLNRRRRKRGDRVRNMLSKGKGGAAGRAREKDKKEKEKEEKDKKAKEKKEKKEKEKKEKGVGASSGGRRGDDDDYSDDSGLLWVVAKQLKTRGEKAAADFSGAWPKE